MTENTTTIETSAPETPAAEPQNTGPTINIVDLQNAVQVIDFAAEQGAFKGWKVIEQVLTVRNRLNEFVVAAAPPKAETDKAEAKTAKKRKK